MCEHLLFILLLIYIIYFTFFCIILINLYFERRLGLLTVTSQDQDTRLHIRQLAVLSATTTPDTSMQVFFNENMNFRHKVGQIAFWSYIFEVSFNSTFYLFFYYKIDLTFFYKFLLIHLIN